MQRLRSNGQWQLAVVVVLEQLFSTISNTMPQKHSFLGKIKSIVLTRLLIYMFARLGVMVIYLVLPIYKEQISVFALSLVLGHWELK